jgi:hypothetical protein
MRRDKNEYTSDHQWQRIRMRRDKKGGREVRVYLPLTQSSFALCTSTNFSLSTAFRKPAAFPSSGEECTYTGGPLR